MFIEVKQPSQITAADKTTAQQLTIEIGAMRINAGSGYPVDKLAALLRGVTQPC
jgi:hypothetical protein